MATLKHQFQTNVLTVTKYRDLMKTVRANRPSDDLGIIKKAYDYSLKHHNGQSRASGEPYLAHPLQVAQVLAAKPKVSVMCCDSPNLGLVVPTMSLGGHGTANMTGNIAPTELAIISTPWTSYAEAENFKTTYLKLLPLLHFTYSAINPVAVKSLMKALGMPAGDLRKPLTNLDGEALAKGVRIVQELGLDKQYGYKVGPISAVAA